MIAHWMTDAVANLAEDGFYYGSQVLSRDFLDIMSVWISESDRAELFFQAGMGRSERRHESSAIRGDRILWLEPQNKHEGSMAAWATIDTLRQTLNQELFAGLVDFEGHLAIYPPGGFYKKHVDTFRDDDARSITVIFYLNQSWLPEDGGELRVYHSAKIIKDYLPTPGSVVIFDARRFPHEVLPARAERHSLTGWYRVRTGLLP
jgi:SM-20-related protein